MGRRHGAAPWASPTSPDIVFYVVSSRLGSSPATSFFSAPGKHVLRLNTRTNAPEIRIHDQVILAQHVHNNGEPLDSHASIAITRSIRFNSGP
ncbi:hypothetical protein VDGE_30731 [Verticillium dahliae]|uniref:Uncharacterized protein n=1 Tax=Verticillium dahliae TaxID=27337 RepID=A0A444S7C8_VERDA|nr:hypothetical protein VDGE_30731 [Verticillium dahliae]